MPYQTWFTQFFCHLRCVEISNDGIYQLQDIKLIVFHQVLYLFLLHKFSQVKVLQTRIVFHVNLKEPLELFEIIFNEFEYRSFMINDAPFISLLSVDNQCNDSTESVFVVLLKIFLRQLDEQLLT